MTKYQDSSMTCSKLMVLLTGLLLLLVFLPSSDTCSCVGQWTPHRLCCRDIVLHGEVQGERSLGRNISGQYGQYYHEESVYTVKVFYIFKGLERVKNMSKDHNTSYVEIYTSLTSCGIQLLRQQSYAVSGSVDLENRMNSELCQDWHSEWDKVPNSYKDVFPMLKTCKCAAANTNYLDSRIFFLLIMLITPFNVY